MEYLWLLPALLPAFGFFWSGCPCCGEICENCPQATSALAVTLGNISNVPSTHCSTCTDFAGTWILPYWPESISNTSQLCDWKFDLGTNGTCVSSGNPAPAYITARILSHATLPQIFVTVGYRTSPPAHAGNLVAAFGWTEDQTDGLTQETLCEAYDIGHDFTVPAAQGVSCGTGTNSATCHVEGA